MRVKLPPHVHQVRNSTGRVYYYLTLHRGTARQAERVRLPDDPRSPEFWAEYARLMGLPPQQENKKSVRALDKAWGGDATNNYDGASPEWNALSDATKVDWKRYRARIVEAWGDLEVAGIAPVHVLALRDRWADKPATANNMLRCLSSMLSWSVPRQYRNDNPCREIKPLKQGDGYAPWPWAVIEAAERELKHKGREDLWWAIALALYSGQRLSDCLEMKWSAIAGESLLHVRQGKTGRELFIPIHRDVRKVLNEIPRRSVDILTSTEGKPWKAFRASWQKNKPSLVKRLDLVFHGLRKSAVVLLLEAGATEAETAAVTGQTLAMVAHYAKQVNQRKLATNAILKWEQADR